jgi:hypothetical protein
MIPKRPFLLYLIIFFFLLAVFNSVLGLIEILKTWNWLRAFEITPSPVYLVFKNAFILLAFTTASVTLWMRVAWAPVFGGAVISVSTLWFWVDRVILTQNPLPFSRHLLMLGLSILLLLFFLLSFYLLIPFMKPNENQWVEETEPSSLEGEKDE